MCHLASIHLSATSEYKYFVKVQVHLPAHAQNTTDAVLIFAGKELQLKTIKVDPWLEKLQLYSNICLVFFQRQLVIWNETGKHWQLNWNACRAQCVAA